MKSSGGYSFLQTIAFPLVSLVLSLLSYWVIRLFLYHAHALAGLDNDSYQGLYVELLVPIFVVYSCLYVAYAKLKCSNLLIGVVLYIITVLVLVVLFNEHFKPVYNIKIENINIMLNVYIVIVVMIVGVLFIKKNRVK